MTGIADRLTAALADRYRIERELGQGGMATGYLAEDLKHHRKVAVKVLRPELAAVIGAERFSREIEVAAQLQHPHILPLLDSGQVESQGSTFCFYVMPYVEGESLRGRLVREGELPVHDAVKILAEVADALPAAHAKGVVHRDIKPDNVMLTGRHALVMDFGVATGWTSPIHSASPSRSGWRGGWRHRRATGWAPCAPTGITCGCAPTPSPHASRSGTASWRSWRRWVTSRRSDERRGRLEPAYPGSSSSSASRVLGGTCASSKYPSTIARA